MINFALKNHIVVTIFTRRVRILRIDHCLLSLQQLNFSDKVEVVERSHGQSNCKIWRYFLIKISVIQTIFLPDTIFYSFSFHSSLIMSMLHCNLCFNCFFQPSHFSRMFYLLATIDEYYAEISKAVADCTDNYCKQCHSKYDYNRPVSYNMNDNWLWHQYRWFCSLEV